MPPTDRYRRKRTIYLSPSDEEAVETIRRTMSLNTRAGALRYAVRQTERRIDFVPDPTAALALIEYVESLKLLPERDLRRLTTLCRKARSELTRP
jgi:hypothetical protein